MQLKHQGHHLLWALHGGLIVLWKRPEIVQGPSSCTKLGKELLSMLIRLSRGEWWRPIACRGMPSAIAAQRGRNDQREDERGRALGFVGCRHGLTRFESLDFLAV